jgi:hypothetical protein
MALHPAGVGIDRVSSERLGGDHADTRESGLEAPLMGVHDAPPRRPHSVREWAH